MKLSKSFLKTYKEAPAVAETISHNLMLRSGMIRQLTRGVYSYLPMAYRVIRKIENIVREEMNKKGAQEIFMPIIQPSDLWEESGRYFAYGKELMRLNDRNNRNFVLGPTHEEVVVDIVRNTINSYKDLPFNLYQIQIKFRDELRPRFGLMRGREFIMKDAYSFHMNSEDLDREYQEMKDAYCKIFTRCGVIFRAVEADTGSIGGAESHEFMVLADSGEDDILYSDSGDYAANIEKATSVINMEYEDEIEKTIEKVLTKDSKTIEEVSKTLNVDKSKTVKAMMYKEVLEEKINYYMALIRGDLEINEIKVKNMFKSSIEFELINEDDMKKLELIEGFIGPKADEIDNKNIKVVADLSLKNLKNFVIGANEKDYHYINANLKDIKIDLFGDIRLAKEGEKSPKDNGILKLAKGIEVGHIFKLGDKYSKALNLKVLDNNGKQQTPIMGCYGIGISRVMAAVIEQNHDENGIIWPISIAPYEVVVIPVNNKDDIQLSKSNEIYEKLINLGIEAVLDDRNEKAGFKFKDSDLIGYPFRIVVGKDISDNLVELVERKTNESIKIELEKAIEIITNKINNK